MPDRERSIGFDRAADYYDRTRGFSPGAFDVLMDVLVRELEGRGRCLEIGVGTGLLALPLANRGIPMMGADLARPMLDKLVEKAGGTPPFPLVQADATRLPFGGGALGCGVFRHVLHLIPDWRKAVDELVRVLAPGGPIVAVEGTLRETWWEIVDRFLAEAGGLPLSVGLHPRDQDALDDVFAERGARPRIAATIPDHTTETVGTFLDQIADGMHSWTWGVDEQLRRRSVRQVRAWAAERFGSLEVPLAPEYDLVVRVYDLR
jgi:ubiquinone/menaquinone biosynthesis C-methylase UbiE